MQKCCIYKLRRGKRLNVIDERFSLYVYLEDFSVNPLGHGKNNDLACMFKYVNADTLELVSQIIGLYHLPANIFEEYFEIHMDTKQVNEKIMQIKRLKMEKQNKEG